MEVKVNNLKEIQEYLNKIPEEMFADVREVFKDATLDAANAIKENITTRLNNRTGALRRSVNTSLTGGTIKTLRASVYSDLVYAPVHEGKPDGSPYVITAKNAYAKMPGGPFLNIPTQANKTPAGVMRMTAQIVFDQGGYIRGRSVWLKKKMMFVLVKQVTIPARLGMAEAAEDQVPTILSRLAAMIGE